MRYFYRVGKFTAESQKLVHHVHEGQIVDVKMEYVVDKKYDNLGWDVRSWKLSSTFKEVTKDTYNKILNDEQKIIARQKELELELGHHFPVMFCDDEILKLKSCGFKFQEL